MGCLGCLVHAHPILQKPRPQWTRAKKDHHCYFFGSQAVVVWKQPQNSIKNEVVKLHGKVNTRMEKKLKESIFCCLFENSEYVTWNCDSSKVVSKKGSDMSNSFLTRFQSQTSGAFSSASAATNPQEVSWRCIPWSFLVRRKAPSNDMNRVWRWAYTMVF